MKYENNNSVSFDFASIPATKPASYKQIKYRAGNVAVALLFSKLGLIPEKVKATNYKLFSQMGMAIQTAAANKPLTHGDIQEMSTNPKKFNDIFIAAFRELFLSSDELGRLLLKDGLSPAKSKKVVSIFAAITGKELPETPAKISVKTSRKNAKTVSVKTTSKKPQTVSEIDRQIEQLMILRDEADMPT